jgi:alpha-tubulin suppressor-like RCC1 family protein
MSGAAYCWGRNTQGQLGDGTLALKRSPVAVSGGLLFIRIHSGGNGESTCALTAGGAVHCWGDNGFGQLGDGTQTRRTAPVAVSGGLSFDALSASGQHTCGRTGAGAVHCWGNNSFGQLGDGTTTRRLTPVPVGGGLSFTAIAAGDFHTCAITAAGAAYCWGYNVEAQLGDNTTQQRNSPTRVNGS